MKDSIIEKLQNLPEEICEQINFGSLIVEADEIRKLFNI